MNTKLIALTAMLCAPLVMAQGPRFHRPGHGPQEMHQGRPGPGAVNHHRQGGRPWQGGRPRRGNGVATPTAPHGVQVTPNAESRN